MTAKQFKCRCYEKDCNVKIYDNSETILDISYRDFDDAFYCSRKLKSVVDKLNELSKENEQLKQRIKELELLNDGLNYALKNIRKIDVEIDVGDKK